MRRSWTRVLFLCGCLTAFASAEATALAAPPDAAVDADAPDAPDANAADADVIPEGIQPTTTPDNLGCALATSGAHHASSDRHAALGTLALVAVVAFLAFGRRRRRVAAIVVGAMASMSFGKAARAAEPEVVQQPPKAQPAQPAPQPPNAQPATAPAAESDDTIGSPRGETRWLAISYNPFTLQASRYGANAEVLVASHHVIIGTLYWANTLTNEDSFNNRFRGIGGELGYRYYSGHDGPRGIFIGPSLLLAELEAIPARGASTSFSNYGLALDVGYQAIVADRWVVGLGGGVQYNRPSQTFPQQELPASVYANPGVRPRLLLALGVAF